MIRVIFESMMEYPRPAIGRSKYDNMDFVGDSFLIRPSALLQEFQCGNQVDAATYLMLASYRSYAEYQVTGDLSLPSKYVNISTKVLETNSLINVSGSRIHFLLEN